MQNDEIQEDVTLENDVEEVEETVEEDETDETTVEEKDWEAEAKKWEAIAKRKAKKEEKTEQSKEEAAPMALDQELIDLTYRNFLGGIGLKSKSVQDEAIATAKKMGVPVTSIAGDEALMSVFKAKEDIAKTNRATAGKGTGGAAIQKKGADYYAAKVKSGKPLKAEDIQGQDAMEILRNLK